MDEHTSHKHFPICPSCGSHKVHRSVRKGPEDWVRHNLLFQSPYRCNDCDERFFGSRVDHHHKKERHQTSTS
jgi:hypothetical protein